MKRFTACLALGLAYTVWPIDLIPDPAVVAFGAGYADDAAVNIMLLIIALWRKRGK